MLLSRVAKLAVSLFISASLFVPLWSAFARPDVSWGIKALLAVVGTTSVALPGNGALLLAFALPLGLFWSTLFSGLTPTALAECLILAFASGASVRFLWPRRDTRDILSRPALVLAVIVATSAFVDLTAMRAVAPARPFWSDLFHHIRFLYWTEDAGNWLVVHDAIRWLGVLAAGVFVERSLRFQPQLRPLGTWLWIGAMAAATSFTFIRVVEILTRRDEPIGASLIWLVTTSRLSVLHPDQNAAGSIFGWMLLAGIVVGLRRRMWWLLGIACPMLMAAFVLAQSRAAVGAIAFMLVARWLAPRLLVRRSFGWAAVGALALVGVVGAWMIESRSHIDPTQALSLRYQMTKVGVKMAGAFPMYGVGLGDYARTSRRFITPDLEGLSVFAREGENAHNNFLQIAVELGLPAGIVFIWLVGPTAMAGWWRSRGEISPEHEGLVLGLSAFLVSAVLGHPLLIPEVAALFFVGLGLTASHQVMAARPTDDYERFATWATVAFFLASLAWRIR